MKPIISDAALIRAFSPLEPYPSAALAVSGGPDSMALMHLAVRWSALAGRSRAGLAVLTVDHGLRPESRDEAAFVGAEAGRLGLARRTLDWSGEKPKTGIQAAARRARYALMTAYCRAHGFACLATAHTEDDQAETFLMRLRRGSGLDGLAAMAAVSEHGGVPIVRPLLGFSKARLLAYLRSAGVPSVNDPSNSNAAFERVRLRHAMKSLAAAGITRSALTLSAARLGRSREALSQAAAEFLERNFRVSNLGHGEIGLETFLKLPSEIALRVLSQVLALIGGKEEAPRMIKAERLLEELRSGKRQGALGGCLAIATPATLHFYREPGRIGHTPLHCEPGSTCIWDGRFVLTFAAGLSGDVSVAPLGAGGWAICRKAFKDRHLAFNANRLAALAAPALWRDGLLLSAPALDFVDGKAGGNAAGAARVELVPRLSHFLKPA
ncbi:MAG: tRNA lysidine(34) synthetase TilS [Rhodomicrobium sp.]